MPGLLAFHAHPDDESISMGGTLAEVTAAGMTATVVTATRGEAGEIHNRSDADAIRPRLGEVREAEQREALATLGVTDLRYLGFRDSGMAGTDDNDHPDAFAAADPLDAAAGLVSVIREVRPDIVTVYDPFGGYGHPDHVQVHRVGLVGFFGAGDGGRFPAAEYGDPWVPGALLATTWSRESMVEMRRAMGASLEVEPASGTPNGYIGLRRDVRRFFDRKLAALLCHDSQFAAGSWVRTVPPETLARFLGEEAFVWLWGTGGDPFAGA